MEEVLNEELDAGDEELDVEGEGSDARDEEPVNGDGSDIELLDLAVSHNVENESDLNSPLPRMMV